MNYRERIARGECVSPLTAERCPVCVDSCDAAHNKRILDSKKKTYVLTVSKVFMKGHPRAGEPTNFRQLILDGRKIHTIRAGDYWRKVAGEVNAGLAILSVREWLELPYNSKQEEFLRLDKMGYQDVAIFMNTTSSSKILLNDAFPFKPLKESIVAENDGLSFADFYGWFPDPFQGGIIHFTDFRY